MDAFRYETLRDCVLEGKCVLVIGPDLFKYNDIPLNKALCEHLKVGQSPYISFFDYKDELFYFKGKNLAASKNAVYRQIRDFHNGLAITEYHEKIAQLPFPLIVNFTPDLLLANAFEKQNLPHEFRFYNKKLNRDPNNIQLEGDEDEIFEASSEYPLVYNLIGHIGYEESLILTYSDLFDFLFNVFGRNNLPLSLRHTLEIQDADTPKNYLFLGLNFHKWYMQVLLRLLNAQTGNQRFVLGEGMEALEATANNPNLDDKSIFYLQDYFTLDLIECNPAEILNHLFDDCKNAGKLRAIDSVNKVATSTPTFQPLYMSLQEWMMRNKVRRVFDALHTFFKTNPNEDALNVTLVNSAKYEELLKQESRGLMYQSELSVERSKVLNTLYTLIQEVKKMESTIVQV